MSTEREAMTLEQALDWLITMKDRGLLRDGIDDHDANAIILSISAHLAREKAEPVLLTLDCGFQIPIRFSGEKGTFVEAAPPELHLGSPKPTTPSAELAARCVDCHEPAPIAVCETCARLRVESVLAATAPAGAKDADDMARLRELLRRAQPLADPESQQGLQWMLEVRAELNKSPNG